MNVINSISNKRGNFTVEFAIVGLFLSILFVFSVDVIVKLSIKGKLDRLSYSLVSILKERTQLYDDDFIITQLDTSSLAKIASKSMERTMSSFSDERFGVTIEELTFKKIGVIDKVVSYDYGDRYQCKIINPLDKSENLSVVTTWNRQASLFRVTLCYKTDNLIGDFLGIDFSNVSSSSVIIGR